MAKKRFEVTPKNTTTAMGVFGFGISCASLMIQDPRLQVFFSILGSVVLAFSLIVLRSFYELAEAKWHRFLIAMKDALEILDTDEYRSMNSKPIARVSPKVYQAVIELHRRIHQSHRGQVQSPPVHQDVVDPVVMKPSVPLSG